MHITRAKVVEGIGKRIIEFLSQIEDFQKMLWEKKKFVLKTEYVITIDRLPEEFHKEILANKKQLKEWEELGFGKISKYDDLIARNDLTGREFKELPVDTKHFSEDFKERLLERLSKQSSFDDLIDGILIKSENYQALNLLHNKYREKIKCIYIDPPFNTGNDEFIYMDNYQHSCWLSMMFDRLLISKDLLNNESITLVSINDIEANKLSILMSNIFGREAFIGPLIWKSRQNKDNRSITGLSNDHEYIIVFGKRLRGEERDVTQYSNPDNDSRGPWASSNMVGILPASKRPNCHYDLVNPETGINYGKPKMGWRFDKKTMNRLIEEKRIIWPDDPIGRPRLKVFLNELKQEYTGFSSVLEAKIFTYHGTKELDNLFGEKQLMFPKPSELIKIVIQQSPSNTNIALDFFAGSGTTAHAVMKLNKEDEGKRKYLLIEMADYFDTVLLPRIKKLCYSFNWKDGKPKDTDGISHFFKYHYLEQYEDTLHNIEFPQEEKGQKALELFGKADECNEYLMKYFLRYETEGSPSLLSLKQFENPFDYKLKIISGNKGEEIVNVDIIETFNYLIGLKVNKYKFMKDISSNPPSPPFSKGGQGGFANGRKYVFVFGEKGNRRIAIVWRPTKDINLEKDREIIENAVGDYSPDEVFITGDAFNPKGYKVIETEFKALMGA